MEITVTAAYEPAAGTLSEQRLQCRRSIAAGGVETIGGNGIKSARGAELCGIAFDDGSDGGKPAFTIRARRPVVRSQNRVGHGCRKRWGDRLRSRQDLERRLEVRGRPY